MRDQDRQENRQPFQYQQQPTALINRFFNLRIDGVDLPTLRVEQILHQALEAIAVVRMMPESIARYQSLLRCSFINGFCIMAADAALTLCKFHMATAVVMHDSTRMIPSPRRNRPPIFKFETSRFPVKSENRGLARPGFILNIAYHNSASHNDTT
ncbi:hypothetical protein [Herbaspirillum sp. RV1423]|uniref:hypothetical protein n=1 Tax=Herbaspirillum sp. RV1423 TaxID=1443993 RepID=UPI001E374A99|nr:hypothetical protein [Herbaspirillum sp. RV1423]